MIMSSPGSLVIKQLTDSWLLFLLKYAIRSACGCALRALQADGGTGHYGWSRTRV